jgi:glycosyl transferase family 25
LGTCVLPSLLDKFSAAYLINLPDRRDRLKSAKKELAKAKWTLGRGGVILYPAQRFNDRGTFPNVGCRGTFFSHMACLRDAQREDRPNVILLEDDIVLTSSLPALTPSILSQLENTRWDFCYLGHEQTGDIPNANSSTKKVQLIPYRGHILQAHFVLINGRILPSLVDHLDRVSGGVEGDQEFGPMPVDGAYNIFRRNSDVVTLIANPKLGWQRPSRSDITPSRVDNWAALRPITSVVRHIRYVASAWRS